MTLKVIEAYVHMAFRLGALAPAFPSSVVYCAANCAETSAGCEKSLLAVVQRLRIFADSKHFVDLPLLPGRIPERIIEYWDAEFGRRVVEEPLAGPGEATSGLREAEREPPVPTFRLARVEGPDTDFEEVRRFLLEHFDYAPGGDLLAWIPRDLPQLELDPEPGTTATGSPPLLHQIWRWMKAQDVDAGNWLMDMVARWRKLGRETSPMVFREPERFSLLPLKHPFIVAGGRFRECYYWDTYFIVRGLLVCGMWETARCCVENLLDLVEQFGFVPNGARIYYLNRTQPPLLSDMVRCIAEHAHAGWDVMTFLGRALPLLEREYNFMMEQRAVKMRTGGTLNRYHAPAAEGPRPESFYEDSKLASDCSMELLGDPRRSELFIALTAAAESGWDFSSRWLRDRRSMCSIRTQLIIPVCFNSFMLRMERNLAFLYQWFISGSRPETEKGSIFEQRLPGNEEVPNDPVTRDLLDRVQQRVSTMQKYLYVPSRDQWIDYDLEADTTTLQTVADWRQTVSSSNFFPLWSGILEHIESEQAASIARGVLQSFEESGLLQDGGVVATLVTDSGQQWDYPNAWPPVQLLLHEAFASLATQFSANEQISNRARELSLQIAIRFLRSVYQGWLRSGDLFEKYHAEKVGESGNGGEYVPQVGFGWTIGVSLALLSSVWQLDRSLLAQVWQRVSNEAT